MRPDIANRWPWPFGFGNIDQIAFGKTARVGQNWPSDRDLVMARQTPDYFNRSIVDWRQARAQLNKRFGLDPLDQMDKDIIEHADLLLIEPIRLVEEKAR